MAQEFKDIDEVVLYTNPFGRYQRILVTLISFACGIAFGQVLITVFVAAEPRWTCVNNSTICSSNLTLTDFTTDNGTLAINDVMMTDAERCKMPKTEWTFDESTETSIISQFDLVCERKFLAHCATTSLYFGWAIGAVAFGMFGDRFGRKVTMPLLTFLLVVAFISSFSPDVYFFIVCRFMVGVLQAAVTPLSAVLISEFTDTEHRPKAIASLGIACTGGIVLVGIKGYLVSNWRYLMIITTLPYIFIVSFVKFIPESFRWLYTRGCEEELRTVIKKMSRWNGVELPDSFTISLPNEESSKTKLKIIDIFVERTLCLRTVVLACGWFTSLLLFFGIRSILPHLTGNIHFDFIIMNIVVFPSYVVMVYSCNIFGRKKTTIITMVLVSIAILCITFIPTTGTLRIIRVTITVIANISIAITLSSLCVWSVELYPTSLRGSAMGMLTLMGHFSGSACPLLAYALSVIDSKAPLIALSVIGVFSSSLLCALPETSTPSRKGIVHAESDVSPNDNYV